MPPPGPIYQWSSVISSSGVGLSAYANFASLPASAPNGSVALTLDTDSLYAYNSVAAAWVPVTASGGGGSLSIGTINTQTASANGAVISGAGLYLQTFASATPGLAPASGGGTTNFLRADGTWAAAGGGSLTLPATSVAYAANPSGTVVGVPANINFDDSTQTLNINNVISGFSGTNRGALNIDNSPNNWVYSLWIQSNAPSGLGNGGPGIGLAYGRGSLNAPTIVGQGDTTGFIGFSAFDGVTYIASGNMFGTITDPSPSTTAMGSSITFETVQNGTISQLPALVIGQDQSLTVNSEIFIAVSSDTTTYPLVNNLPGDIFASTLNDVYVVTPNSSSAGTKSVNIGSGTSTAVNGGSGGINIICGDAGLNGGVAGIQMYGGGSNGAGVQGGSLSFSGGGGNVAGGQGGDIYLSPGYCPNGGTPGLLVLGGASGFAGNSGAILMETPNPAGGFSSGNITISTGLVSGLGVRGTITIDGPITVASNFIHNVLDPVLAQDAATKAYVDAHTSSTAAVEQITLGAGDITNQYIDLGFTATGSSAVVNSVLFLAALGGAQRKTIDYTVSLAGGVAGVTRLSFIGALATGGVSALVNGDIIIISYSH